MTVQAVGKSTFTPNIQKQKTHARSNTASAPSSDQLNISTDAQLKSFLDKVKSGTVSDQDLKSMKAALANLPDNALNATDPMGAFLAKVKKGTVTDDDLSLMWSQLNAAKPTVSETSGTGGASASATVGI